MSVISEKVRVALYTKLNVSGVTSLATGGVHYQHAPANASTPYVVFNRVAPGPVSFTVFGPLQILENDLWQIKAIVREADSITLEPVQLAQDILEACEAAIADTLTITGNTVEFVKRVSDIPGFRELVNDSWVYHEGYNLRVQTS